MQDAVTEKRADEGLLPLRNDRKGAVAKHPQQPQIVHLLNIGAAIVPPAGDESSPLQILLIDSRYFAAISA